MSSSNYLAPIRGAYARGMIAYIQELTEQREQREYEEAIRFLTHSDTTFRASHLAAGEQFLDINEIGHPEISFAIAWESEYGYPVHVFWHKEGFEIRTARYISRNCLILFPGARKLMEEVGRQNEQANALIQQMSQESIMRAGGVDLETAQRWMIEAEERDPMPEYDAAGARHNRTHNRFGEPVTREA